MPSWIKIWPIIFLLSCGSDSSNLESINLLDGEMVNSRVGNRIWIKFDGERELLIEGCEKRFDIDPMTPSVIHFSKDRSNFVINFGNGSGQVYDIMAYSCRNGTRSDLYFIDNAISEFANSIDGCEIQIDEISKVFQNWRGEDVFTIKTEDFSRKRGCANINRSWIVDLGNKEILYIS